MSPYTARGAKFELVDGLGKREIPSTGLRRETTFRMPDPSVESLYRMKSHPHTRIIITVDEETWARIVVGADRVQIKNASGQFKRNFWTRKRRRK